MDKIKIITKLLEVINKNQIVLDESLQLEIWRLIKNEKRRRKMGYG